MSRSAALVIVLALAPALFAASADLQVELVADYPVIHSGDDLFFGANIRNNGPDAAEDFTLLIDVPAAVDGLRMTYAANLTCDAAARPIRCTGQNLAPNGFVSAAVRFIGVAPDGDSQITIRETVTGTTPDPKPSNNTAEHTVTVSSAPDLQLFLSGSSLYADPGAPLRYQGSLYNVSGSPAHDVVITANLSGGQTFAGARFGKHPLTCSQSGTVVTCTTPLLGGHDSDAVLFDVVLPRRATAAP